MIIKLSKNQGQRILKAAKKKKKILTRESPGDYQQIS
jgi:hypothetical protein